MRVAKYGPPYCASMWEIRRRQFHDMEARECAESPEIALRQKSGTNEQKQSVALMHLESNTRFTLTSPVGLIDAEKRCMGLPHARATCNLSTAFNGSHPELHVDHLYWH